VGIRVQVWFPGAEKHVEDERIDQAAYREAVQNLHDSGTPTAAASLDGCMQQHSSCTACRLKSKGPAAAKCAVN
jgi:hypothetical protein